MNIQRIAAFSYNNTGGNPAGVAILDTMPSEKEMFAVAKEVGYSETAFLHPQSEGWRIRYFAPELEVPFCGHATIATAAALGEKYGTGTYTLYLNHGEISVSVEKHDETYVATLQSPNTRSKPAPDDFVLAVLKDFGWSKKVLHPDYPPYLAFAGAEHLILVLKDRKTLAAMHYDLDTLKATIANFDLATVSLIWIESDTRIHARNPFPNGGIYEDPATGAAAAALAGYLRDINWQGDHNFEILQGEDMGIPSLLKVGYTPVSGARINVMGATRIIDKPL